MPGRTCGLNDLVHVQCVEECLAVADVVEGVAFGAVEHGEQEAESLDGFYGAGGFKLWDRQVWNGVDGHGAAGLKRVGAGGGVGDDLPFHLGGTCWAWAVVVVVALELDHLGCTVVGHLVWAGADWVGVESGCVCFHDGLWHDLYYCEAFADDAGCVVEVDGDSGVILLGD